MAKKEKYAITMEISQKELDDRLKRAGIEPTTASRRCAFSYLSSSAQITFENRDFDWKQIKHDLEVYGWE